MLRGNRKIAMMLPRTLHWSIHNIVGHPVMEVCHILSFAAKINFGRGGSIREFGVWVHDVTIPEHEVDNG